MKNSSDKYISEKRSVAETEARLKALIEATSDVVYSLSPDWQEMRELDGRGFLKDADAPTTNWRSDNIYPDDMDIVNDKIEECIREKKIFFMEHRVLRADGTPGWTSSKAIPILYDHGNIVEWFGIAQDISQRKEDEEALLKAKAETDQQKRLYETVTSSTPDLLYVFDLNYRFTYANQALLNMWGRTWEDSIGKGLLEIGYEPWHAEMHEREIDEIKENKLPIRGEVSFPHAVLGSRIYDYIFTPVFNEYGEVEAIAGATRDVTERKRWEESLKTSSEALQELNKELSNTNRELELTLEEIAKVNDELVRAHEKIEEGQVAFQLAVNAANFGTWFVHSITREFITDARSKELFGYYEYETLSIKQALAQITDEYRPFVTEKLENAINNNGDYDVTYPVIGFHDKRLRWLRAIGNLKADPSGTFSAFTGIVMDITDQYIASAEIKRAEESLRMAVDAAGLGTFQMSKGNGSFTASQKLKEFYGFYPDEFMSYEAAANQIHPDFRTSVAANVERAFSEGARFDMEYPIIGFHDEKLRWVRTIGEVQQKDGKKYFTGVIHEITEKKLDEIRKNDFIGMVSHELKTPLTSIKGYIQLMQLKFSKTQDESFSNILEKANTQINKMTSMINGFLDISRLESGKIHINRQFFDLAPVLKEAEEECIATINSHVIVFSPIESVKINADRDKIGQVIHNLISNAVKYSSPGTTIRVSCTSDNEFAYISVKDQGKGIKPEDAVHIFDRYYRVEGEDMHSISGFGIGLYLCSEIISHHKGTISLESEVGVGSDFIFSLPLNMV
ncbi:PAS domain S-box protein [Chryseobacterium sp. SSA4.19]|uniref:PAS domain-containing sensor histidine kinase n=1 Tax=Chryseobacterium sp. SSA4.19 TaxID=2919915 RepID=UPI001F4E1666|nr:PAS domain-containing sensor histidine kinase [Chryseobacterium sp. SSA4.19]MCJ8152760.1 PAS domain S-box protein [Chryseobacterium sp. SSA4.19]